LRMVERGRGTDIAPRTDGSSESRWRNLVPSRQRGDRLTPRVIGNLRND
jgi:hypothetical protein